MSTKISTEPTKCTGKLFYVSVTSITPDVFPNPSWKLGLSALPIRSPWERASKRIPDNVNRDTNPYTILVYIYKRFPKWSTMPKVIVTLIVTHQKHFCILIFLYNASHNKINVNYNLHLRGPWTVHNLCDSSTRDKSTWRSLRYPASLNTHLVLSLNRRTFSHPHSNHFYLFIWKICCSVDVTCHIP